MRNFVKTTIEYVEIAIVAFGLLAAMVVCSENKNNSNYYSANNIVFEMNNQL